jgi:hypothetical protein
MICCHIMYFNSGKIVQEDPDPASRIRIRNLDLLIRGSGFVIQI